MLSSYLGGRARDLHLDNVTMKLVALLCHLTSIYTLLDRQIGSEEASQWTESLLQFKLAAQDWLFEHARTSLTSQSERETLCDVICPTMAGKLFASRKGFMTTAPFMAGKYETYHIREYMDPRSIA
jgi:hypothetical protein